MTRDELIAAMQATRSPKPVAVQTEKWGTVYVKPRTVEEVDADTEDVDEVDGKHRRLARGAARVICDETGKRLFDPQNDADVDLIAEQPWSMLRSLLAAVDGEADEKKETAGTS